MTSKDTLTPIQTALETIVKHDFVSPQSFADSISQREKQEMEAAQTYILQQSHPTVQNLVPLCIATGPKYTVRLDTVGSFLKPQPHMLISENPGDRHVAEVKFEIRGYDTTIIYKNNGASQRLAFQNSEDQGFECWINGKAHRWHPLGPSKSVFELTEGANKRVALFVYEEGMAQRTGSTSSDPMKSREKKIGEVHVMGDSLREPLALQQTLFSALVVVEQTKRRATSIASGVPPPQSKTLFSGRRRSKEEGAEKG